MKTLCTGGLVMVALLMFGALSNTSLTVNAQPNVLMSAELPVFLPLTQDLGPLIDLLN